MYDEKNEFIEHNDVTNKYDLSTAEAKKWYKDVARHYSWNLLMTKAFYTEFENINKAMLKARQIANNH